MDLLGLPQEIDKMNWRGTYRWESDSEYIVYVVSNIQNGSIEIIEITSKTIRKWCC